MKQPIDHHRHLSEVTDWIFDLDNTLYPSTSNLFAQIDAKMTAYVINLLDMTFDDARKLQKKLFHEYGTTLRGLMDLYKIDAEDFLARVHDIDYSVIEPNLVLGDRLKALPGRKFIFTNGDRAHAERTAQRLGILDHFEGIFDIVAAGLTPKPAKESYERFAAAHAIIGPNAVMFEDIAENLRVPKELGMATVLITPKSLPGAVDDFRHEDHDKQSGKPAHVDFITSELPDFLGQVLGQAAIV